MGAQISRGYSPRSWKTTSATIPIRPPWARIEFSELEAYALSDTFAACIGKYHLERSKKQGGPADGQFSMVLEKTADGWKIVLDHTT
jgi:ketosteroid isomerase-like protein